MNWAAIWIAYGSFCLFALALPEAKGVPVVPNFQQGTLKSTTTTKSKVNEVINSYEYRTGYEYTVSGTNIAPKKGSVAPLGMTTTSNTANGITSQWTGLDMTTKPTWQIVKPGASFQFVETVTGPGLSNHTIVQRETEIESVTESLSTFTQ